MQWPPRSGRTRQFPEVDRFAYFPLAVARRKIAAGQRPLIEELAGLAGS
jgi:predicted NUDIX family NTP pyrophosphohydrolase